MNVVANATFEELVTLLSQGIGQRLLYFGSHPRVKEYAREFTAMLYGLLSRENKDQFFLGFAEGNLLHNGIMLVGPTILGKRTIDFLKRIKSGGILFRAGTTPREVLELFELTVEVQRDVPTLEELRKLLASKNVTNVDLSPPYEHPEWFGQFLFEGAEDDSSDTVGERSEQEIVQVYQSMFETVQNSHALAESNATIEIDEVRAVGEQLVGAGAGGLTDAMRLVKYPDYDSFTVGHSVRVAVITVLVAQRAGLPAPVLVELATASLLHDVGKARVPPEILYKPDRLTHEEFRVIARHPIDGAEILLENQSASPMAIGAAWGHHLRFDGGGYPAMEQWGLSTKLTRLLTVCDFFEAITAVRPYKRGLEPRRAYEIMLRDRGAFDPDCFAALVTAMGLYPPGSAVALTTGEQATVTVAGSEFDKPVVRITHDSRGAPLPPADQRVLDLSAPAVTGVRVARLLESTSTGASISTTTGEVTATCNVAPEVHGHTAHGPCTGKHHEATPPPRGFRRRS